MDVKTFHIIRWEEPNGPLLPGVREDDPACPPAWLQLPQSLQNISWTQTQLIHIAWPVPGSMVWVSVWMMTMPTCRWQHRVCVVGGPGSSSG